MAVLREESGPYISYRLDHEFAAIHIVHFRTLIADDLTNRKNDFAINLQDLSYIDKAGIRFFANLQKNLEAQERKLVFYGGTQDIQSRLSQELDFQIYTSQLEFERDFHDMDESVYETIFSLTEGEGPFKKLTMSCPVCKCHDVPGFVLDKSRYEEVWSHSDITKIWNPIPGEDSYVDFAKYQVIVCPQCFFASPRLDWFSVKFAEGKIDSSLRGLQIENLKNAAIARRNLVGDKVHENRKFFNMPREKNAAFLSWQLNELTQKSLFLEHNRIDAYEVSFSNLMMCRYASDGRTVDDHMNTAMAWLQNLLEHQEWYSTGRIAAAYTFAISIFLARGRLRDAGEMFHKLRKEFSGEPECESFLKRSRSLLEGTSINTD